MRLRLELFVADLDASVRYYERALGFGVERREADYASLRNGGVVLGLAPTAKLPAGGDGPGFTQQAVTAGHGAGVEIVLEVENLDAALRRVQAAGRQPVEAPQDRPWGLRDFRVVDPDGYYLRVTTRRPTGISRPADAVPPA